jgi:Trypsin
MSYFSLKEMNQMICPAPFHLELSNYKNLQFSSETIDHLLAQSTGPELFYKYVADLSDVNKLDFETTKIFNILARPVSAANCSKLIQKITNTSEIDESTQLCAGNSRFAVPGVCESVAGGPWIMEGLNEDSNGYIIRIPYLVGVQSFGVDCGFGIPAVASNVTSFIPWIDSVLYPVRNPEKTDLKAAKDFRSMET